MITPSLMGNQGRGRRRGAAGGFPMLLYCREEYFKTRRSEGLVPIVMRVPDPVKRNMVRNLGEIVRNPSIRANLVRLFHTCIGQP